VGETGIFAGNRKCHVCSETAQPHPATGKHDTLTCSGGESLPMAFQLVDPRGNGFAVSSSGAGVIDLARSIVPRILRTLLWMVGTMVLHYRW